MSDDFYKYVTPAAPKPKRQREFRTDRNNNPIAAAVTTGGKNQFTQALDDAEIPWEHGDQFPGNPKLSTIRIKGDPIEGARAILSNTNALKWYRSTTGKNILPKYNVKSNQDFANLPIEHQNDIINGIYESEGGHGTMKPAPDDFDKYVSTGQQSASKTEPDDDFDKYVTTPVEAGASGSVSLPTKRTTPKATSSPVAQMSAVTNAISRQAGKRQPVGMGNVQQASRMRDPSLGELRQSEDEPIRSLNGQPSRVTQTSDELRVMKGEQPVDRQVYSRQQDAQTRLSQMRELGNDFDPKKEEQWHAANDAAIRNETERYRQEIRASHGGDAGKWLSEFGSKAGAGLAELGAGVTGNDTLRIKAEAAARAAHEEGADRNVVSRFIQDVGAGFISTAPELAAMRLGVNPVGAFAAGSALRAGGGGRDPNAAAVHGAGTGLAFEVPGVGEGLKRVVTKAGGVGATSAGLELAQGASPREALVTGATNAAMVAVPEIAGGRRNAGENAEKLFRDGVPERPETLAAQMEQRGYSLIPEGTQRPPIPRGFRTEKTPDGVVYFDPKRISREEIRNTPTADLLGHVEPKSESTTETVVAKTPEGTEIQSSAVSPENAGKQAEVMAEQYPDAKIETGGNDLAAQVVAERLQPQRYSHTDWGNVVRAEDQTNAGKGRTKVYEEGAPSKFHYPRTVDLRGRGNERMIPLKAAEPAATASPEVSAEATRVASPSQKLGNEAQPSRDATTESRKVDRVTDPRTQTNWDIEYEMAQPSTPSVAESGQLPNRGTSVRPETKPSEVSNETTAKTSGVVADAPEPSTTSARKAQMAADRIELDLPELPPTERRGWQESLNRAHEEGLDRKAALLADEVLDRPRAFTPEETAGVALRAQEIKNDLARVRKEMVGASDAETVQAKVAEAQALQREFNKLTAAAKTSGGEKGRSLAAQKLTINQDFDLTSLIQRATEAKERPLTRKEEARYEQIVAERDRAIADRDAALEQLHSKRLQSELDRTTRQRRRSETKETLDKEAVMIRENIVAEFARLKSQMGSVRSLGGLGSLDPNGVITKNLLRYARNRAKAEIGLKAETLIDDAYSLVKDFGATRRQVAEVLSGYGRVPVDKRSEAAKQLASIRSEINTLLRAEDVAAGRRSIKQEGPKRDLVRNQKRLDQLLKQEKEWERKFNERDFEPKPKAEPYPYNSDVRRAEDRVRIAEAKFNREMEREKPGHQIRNLSGIMKAWLLSGPPTQAMNIVGTGSYQMFREIARLPAAIADVVLMKPFTGRRGITGPSPSAMLDSVLHGASRGGRDFLEIMRHGATKEQMDRHQYQEIDFGVNTGNKKVDSGVKLIELAHNALFRFMSGSDRVFYQQSYKRNLIDRARVQALNEGVSDAKARTRELVAEAENNPKSELHADADHDALVSTFNNDNYLSSKIKRARSAVINPKSLMSRKSAQRLNAVENFAVDFVLPFDRTPTNVVSRIVEASPLGYIKNGAQLVAAAMRKSMPLEHQRQFSQTFGNATAGTTLLALGWYFADKDRKIITVEGNDVFLKIPGLPKINLRTVSPVGNVMATGARLRAAHQDENSTWGDYAKSPLREATNIPVLRASSPITETLRDPERSGPKTVARFASMAVPFGGAVRFAGKAIDPADKRYPDTSFKEQFQQGIPKWRESLPASRVRLLGSENSPAVQEAERLGITIKGAVKKEDETPEEFKTRQAIQNGNIRTQIENVVDLPDYDKASDDRKREWLKFVAEDAAKKSQGSIIEKPKKEGGKEFVIPSMSSGFERAYPADALSKFERMNPNQRQAVRDSMAQKAWLLTHSTALSDEEKAAYKERLDRLGITPRPAGERPRTTTMRQQLSAQ